MPRDWLAPPDYCRLSERGITGQLSNPMNIDLVDTRGQFWKLSVRTILSRILNFSRPWLLAVGWLAAGAVRADDWPQWLGPQRDAVWRETGILKEFPPGGLPVRWRTAIGAGYSGPAVANGRVYVTDRVLASGAQNPTNQIQRSTVRGVERVLCLNATDGQIVWQHEYECAYTVSYPAGPRTTPVVSGGKVYTLGAEGNLLCLDAATGKVGWERNFKQDYHMSAPTWGFAANPLVDGNQLICLVGGPSNVVVACDKETGRELWHARSANEPGYSSPIIITAGGQRQLIVWSPEELAALNPATGAVYWSEPFPIRNGLTVATPYYQDGRLLVTAFYNGALMLRLNPHQPTATVLWRGQREDEKNTDGLHGIMCTPLIVDGYVYGVCSYGQLRCLKAETGERVWETLAATTADGKPARWANAFLVKNGDRFFLNNEAGDLIIAQLHPQGYHEISRTHLLDPTNTAAGRKVVWSHPAYADRCIFVRNDREILCVSLAKR